MSKIVGKKLFTVVLFLGLFSLSNKASAKLDMYSAGHLSLLGKNFSSESNYKELTAKHYELEMWINPNTKEFRAVNTIDFIALKSGEIIILDSEQLNITSVNFDNGEALDFSVDQNLNTLKILRDFEKGEAFSIKIQYDIDYNQYEENGKTNYKAKIKPGLWFVDPEDTQLDKGLAYTKFEPHLAARMFPCQNTPKVRSSFKSIIHSPNNMTSEAAGDLISETQTNSQRTRTFIYSQTIPVYLYALIVGDYKKTSISECSDQTCSVDVSVITENNSFLHNKALEYTANAANYIEILSSDSYFNIPFPVNTMRLIFVPPSDNRRPFAAMENMGMIIFNELYIQSDSFYTKGTLPHELIHSWFGNSLTTENWQDLFVNEGPTSYYDLEIMYDLFPEHRDSVNMAWQRERRKVVVNKHILERSKKHGTLRLNSTGSENTIFDLPNGRDIYTKGAWLLRSVEQAIEIAQEGHGKIGINWVMSSILNKTALPGNITLDEMIDNIIFYAQSYANTNGFELEQDFAKYIQMLAFEPGMPILSVFCVYYEDKNKTTILITQDGSKLDSNSPVKPSKAYPIGMIEVKKWDMQDPRGSVQYAKIFLNGSSYESVIDVPGKTGFIVDPKGKHFTYVRDNSDCYGKIEDLPIAKDDYRLKYKHR